MAANSEHAQSNGAGIASAPVNGAKVKGARRQVVSNSVPVAANPAAGAVVDSAALPFADPLLAAPLKSRHGKRRPKAMNSTGKALVAVAGVCLLVCVAVLIAFMDDILGTSPQPKTNVLAKAGTAETDATKTDTTKADAAKSEAKSAEIKTSAVTAASKVDDTKNNTPDAAIVAANKTLPARARGAALAGKSAAKSISGAVDSMSDGDTASDTEPAASGIALPKIGTVPLKTEKVFSSGKPEQMMDGDEPVEDLELALTEDPLPKRGADVVITREINLRMAEDQEGTSVKAGTKAKLSHFADDQAIVSLESPSGSKVAGLVPIIDIDFGDKQVVGDDPDERAKLAAVGIEIQHHPVHQLVDVLLAPEKMTDELMASVETLPQITRLVVNGSEVTDEGLKHARKLERLRTLDLRKTKITDEGLRHLAELQTLRQLDLRDTEVTLEAVERLQKDLPRVRITHAAMPGF